STPLSTSPTSAGNVSSLARSPVAPKMTSASTRSTAMPLPPKRRPTPPQSTLDSEVAERCRTSGRSSALGLGDGPRRVHQTDGAESLGEVAQLLAAVVDLLGQQADVVHVCDGPLEHGSGAFGLVGEGQGVRE